jgi:hypothetical protein
MKKILILSVLVLFLGSLFALESDPSETVGFVKYGCVTNANGDYNIMALPMDAGYTLASELGADYPLITSIRYWDSTNQIWVASDNFGTFWWPDNPILPNEVYYVTVSGNTDIYIAGGFNAPASYDLVTNANGDYNTLMLPLDSSFILSSELGDDIGVCTSIRDWDQINQIWVASDNFGTFWWPDNPVEIAGAYYVTVSANITWPVTDAISSPKTDAPSKPMGLKSTKIKK